MLDVLSDCTSPAAQLQGPDRDSRTDQPDHPRPQGTETVNEADDFVHIGHEQKQMCSVCVVESCVTERIRLDFLLVLERTVSMAAFRFCAPLCRDFEAPFSAKAQDPGQCDGSIQPEVLSLCHFPQFSCMLNELFVLCPCFEISSCVLGRKCQLHSTHSSGVYSINIEDIFALEELRFNETRREKNSHLRRCKSPADIVTHCIRLSRPY